ncbi:GDP-mannose 4,6-dehydratase [bacterium]|nr:GDP-mannose 4,6-dehydratase [bacterium]
MKVLVTGTAGFIGFHLAQSLIDDGHEVVGVDNFNDYYPVVLKRARHDLLEAREGYVGYEIDVAEHARLLEIVRTEKVDTICHLAAQAGVRYSLQNPFAYQKSNLEGFLSILEATRQAELPRLVYASSSSVYGGNKKMPFSEEDSVEHPISLYAATKRANELMAHTYTHLYGFQSIGLRFFTVYGPWGRPDMAIWLFTEAVSRGLPISVFNHGKMERDFTYIDDIIAGVKASLTADTLDKYEILNLGNHQSEKLMDFINAIGKHLGKEPIMEFKPMQPGDVPATYADIKRASDKLGFSPVTGMDEGVGRFVAWYKECNGLTDQVWQDRQEAKRSR